MLQVQKSNSKSRSNRNNKTLNHPQNYDSNGWTKDSQKDNPYSSELTYGSAVQRSSPLNNSHQAPAPAHSENFTKITASHNYSIQSRESGIEQHYKVRPTIKHNFLKNLASEISNSQETKPDPVPNIELKLEAEPYGGRSVSRYTPHNMGPNEDPKAEERLAQLADSSAADTLSYGNMNRTL